MKIIVKFLNTLHTVKVSIFDGHLIFCFHEYQISTKINSPEKE